MTRLRMGCWSGPLVTPMRTAPRQIPLPRFRSPTLAPYKALGRGTTAERFADLLATEVARVANARIRYAGRACLSQISTRRRIRRQLPHLSHFQLGYIVLISTESSTAGSWAERSAAQKGTKRGTGKT